MKQTIPCPHCQKENSIDRFYCKSCRTLLSNGQLNDAQVQDWFSALEDEWSKESTPEQKETARDEDLILANEEMPDWVAKMAPDPSMLETELPTIDTERDADDAFSNLITTDEEALSGFTDENESVPAWLQGIDADADETGSDESVIVDGLPIEDATAEITPLDEGDDWQKLLRNLPPSKPALTKAAIPDWLGELDPTSDTIAPINLPEAAEAVEIELIIAQPRTSASPIQAFTVTPEQQKQVDLLRQLVAPVQHPEAAEAGDEKSESRFAAWVQPGLALLLTGVILFGLLARSTVFRETANVVPFATAMESLDLAAGKPVLIAFEYTPSLAGELAPQADVILQRVAENGSQILTVSQFAAGTAVAKLATQSYSPIDLGYIPANAIGLRQLGDCMADTACTTLNTRQLDRATADQLNNVALIIILTGDRDSLVGWIEQVGSQQDTPLTAITTRALAPVVAPYFGSGQLHALLSEQLDADIGQSPQQQAQRIAQLLIATLFIIGGVGYGLRRKRA